MGGGRGLALGSSFMRPDSFTVWKFVPGLSDQDLIEALACGEP